MVPPMAHLPVGVINYVTRAGMDELLTEQQALIDEIKNLDITSENEYNLPLITGFFTLLLQSLQAARSYQTRIVKDRKVVQVRAS